jgi:hypothetical protein
MKKIIYILPLLLLWACSQDIIDVDDYTTYQPIDIFEVQSSVVNDGDVINVNLISDGEYKLSLVDEFTNVTHTNEVFDGKIGSNQLNIYTKALPKGSYKLLVIDTKNNIIKQTTIKL